MGFNIESNISRINKAKFKIERTESLIKVVFEKDGFRGFRWLTIGAKNRSTNFDENGDPCNHEQNESVRINKAKEDILNQYDFWKKFKYLGEF